MYYEKNDELDLKREYVESLQKNKKLYEQVLINKQIAN